MEPVTKKIKLEPCEDWSVEEDSSEYSEDLLEFSETFQVDSVKYIRARQSINLPAPVAIEEVRIVQEEFQACLLNIQKRLNKRIPVLQEDLSDKEEAQDKQVEPVAGQFWEYIVEILRDLYQDSLADIAVWAANNFLSKDFLKPNTFDI